MTQLIDNRFCDVAPLRAQAAGDFTRKEVRASAYEHLQAREHACDDVRRLVPASVATATQALNLDREAKRSSRYQVDPSILLTHVSAPAVCESRANVLGTFFITDASDISTLRDIYDHF